MAVETLYRLGGVAGIIAGVSIFVGTLLNDLVKKNGAFFNFLGALIGLFGITGLYLWQRAESGTFGLVGYAAMFIGLALIACIDFAGALITPSISEDEQTRLGTSAAMRNIMIASLIFLLGELFFGVSLLSAGVFPQIPTVMFMIGFLATFVRPVYPIITFIGLAISSSGLIWLGVCMISMAGG